MRRIRGTAVSLALVAGVFTASQAMAGDPAMGAEVYKTQKCGNCHGDGGMGDGIVASKMKLELTDWTNKAAMADITDQFIKDIIEKGGKAVGKSPKMPAYGKKLDATMIEKLLAFIRSLPK